MSGHKEKRKNGNVVPLRPGRGHHDWTFMFTDGSMLRLRKVHVTAEPDGSYVAFRDGEPVLYATRQNVARIIRAGLPETPELLDLAAAADIEHGGDPGPAEGAAQ